MSSLTKTRSRNEKAGLSVLTIGLGLVGMDTFFTVSAEELKIGTTFPNVTLPSLQDGRPLSIADFRGEKLILQIWASW